MYVVKADSYSPMSGILRYTLPVASRVHVQAGSAILNATTGRSEGPVMKTIVDRAPRAAGAVVEQWNGFDESGTIHVPDLRNFVVGIAATPLPENTIITVGNRKITFLEWAENRTGNSLVTRPSVDPVHHGGLLALNGLSGLTASGNASKDAINVRAGTIGANITWHASTIPYLLTGTVSVNGTANPALTIEAGVTVQLAPQVAIEINNGSPGSLRAIGTATAPITFTSTGSTNQGSWLYILLAGAGTTASQISYATIEYGAYSPYQRGALHVMNSSPSLDHITFRSNQVAGLVADSGTFAVSSSTFIGNGAGIIARGTATIDGRLNFWSSTDGPSGSGYGTGQSVSAAVKFEPWLKAAPTATQFFVSTSVVNRTFSPTVPTTSEVSFATSITGAWSATIYDAAHVSLRTFAGSGLTGTIVWDGTNASGSTQSDGTYTYELSSTTAANEVTATAMGRVMIVGAFNAWMTAPVAPAFFSPNGDGVQDTAMIGSTSTFDDTTWTVVVKNLAGTTVRSSTAIGRILAYEWDGRDNAGVLQADGLYTYDITASEGASVLTGSAFSTIDNTVPTAELTGPATTVSNIYASGNGGLAVAGSATDANLASWTLDYGLGASPSTWTVLQTGAAPVAASQLGTWSTAGLGNGLYSVRLQVRDQAGNLRTTTRQSSIANFSMTTQSVHQLNATLGETIVYSTTVPFAVTETLLLKNQAGQVVRTLVNAARNAGTFTDTWDGRNDSGALVPDGAYFVVANVDDGTHTFAFDLSNQYLEGWDYNYPSRSDTFDPYNNQPMSLTYTFPQPGRVNIIFTNKTEAGPCGPSDYCLKHDEYQAAGTYTVNWYGTDDAGALRSDLTNVSVTSFRTGFAQNAVVVYGSKPSIAGLSVSPAVFAPAFAPQTIAFDLTTFQSASATVQLSFRNIASGSTLRTITLADQAPGHVIVTWDGRADNGMWVAAGDYLVTLAITDPIGNAVLTPFPTTVKY